MPPVLQTKYVFTITAYTGGVTSAGCWRSAATISGRNRYTPARPGWPSCSPNPAGDTALVLLGRIVNGADTDNTLCHQAEGPGLQAVAEGFRHLGYEDDYDLNAAEWIVYDALYAYAQEMVKRGKPSGRFAN
jgi:Chromate resistance exported protein